MINIQTYQDIGVTILDNQVYSIYFKPFPKNKDYSSGYINRYFVQKINDHLFQFVPRDWILADVWG